MPLDALDSVLERVRNGGGTSVERNAARVLDHAPGADFSRTRDVIQLDVHGEDGIVLLVTAEALELRLPTIEWTHGAYGPESSTRLWKRLAWKKLDDDALAELIDVALQARQAELRPCQHCGDSFPPDRRFDDDTCHGCASKDLGVLY